LRNVLNNLLCNSGILIILISIFLKINSNSILYDHVNSGLRNYKSFSTSKAFKIVRKGYKRIWEIKPSQGHPYENNTFGQGQQCVDPKTRFFQKIYFGIHKIPQSAPYRREQDLKNFHTNMDRPTVHFLLLKSGLNRWYSLKEARIAFAPWTPLWPCLLRLLDQ